MDTSSKKSKIKVLMTLLKELTLIIGASDKEVSYSKEVYSDIKILCLKEVATSELESIAVYPKVALPLSKLTVVGSILEIWPGEVKVIEVWPTAITGILVVFLGNVTNL